MNLINDYYPYDNRREHEFVNKLSADIVRIRLALSDIEKQIDIYMTKSQSTMRKEDN